MSRLDRAAVALLIVAFVVALAFVVTGHTGPG